MMPKIHLSALTYLAPNLLSVYQFMLADAARRLNITITLQTGADDYRDFQKADLLFICGLPYVLRTAPHLTPSPIEALVAPVLRGERYAGYDQPVYFSDVIVHADSAIHSFAGLRGHSWGYNEPESQSGYGIMRYELAKQGLTNGLLSRVIQVGYHYKAIRNVAHRRVDAATIDSQVLEIFLRDHPALRSRLRVIATVGPSPIQPLAASHRLTPSLKDDIRDVFLEMHTLPTAQAHFEYGLIDHFVAVQDQDYDSIREMVTVCQQANFMEIR